MWLLANKVQPSEKSLHANYRSKVSYRKSMKQNKPKGSIMVSCHREWKIKTNSSQLSTRASIFLASLERFWVSDSPRSVSMRVNNLSEPRTDCCFYVLFHSPLNPEYWYPACCTHFCYLLVPTILWVCHRIFFFLIHFSCLTYLIYLMFTLIPFWKPLPLDL